MSIFDRDNSEDLPGGAIQQSWGARLMAPRNEYLRTTKTLTYSYLFTLPLFILYELGVLAINAGNPMGIRVGADVWIKQVFGLIGLGSTIWIGLAVLCFGAIIVLYERKQHLRLRWSYFGLMFAESALYAVLLGSLVGAVVNNVFGLRIPPLQIAGRGSLLQGLVLSLGAGIYEELVFRLILVSGLFMLMRLVPASDTVRRVVAMVIGAIIFSWAHYIGALGDTFTLSSFTFRLLMGLALNLLFMVRGFGVAAMTHSLYDVWVTLLQW